jgi:RecB family exonuclease
MEQSKQEYEKPFAHETELKDKVARQFELNAQLDLENGKVEDIDLNGAMDRDDDVPGSHVAEMSVDYHTECGDKQR